MNLAFKNFLIIFGLLIMSCPALVAQPAISFQGDYNYSLNTIINEVYALTPDQKLGVTLTSVFNDGKITSFDPITGAKFDTEDVGFSPAAVGVVPAGDGYRVAAMVGHGATVKIYDMDRNGTMTFRSQANLADPGEAVNMVLSASAQAGFSRTTNGINNQVVAFSLDTGAELSRVNAVAAKLTMFEGNSRRIISTGSRQKLVFIDASDPAHLQYSGDVMLPPVPQGAGSGRDEMSVAFSANGNHVFAGSGFGVLSSVNTTTRQIEDSFDNAEFGPGEVKLFDRNETRTLAVRHSSMDGNFRGFVLINASNPANLTAFSQVNLGGDMFSIRDFNFTRDGRRLIVASVDKVYALTVPGLAQVFTNSLFTNLAFRVETFGQPERIIGAWGSDNNFAATIYTMPNRTNRVANFDADDRTDIALFRPSDGNWYSLDSGTGNFRAFHFGQAGDKPVPADYDGDGTTDVAVYRPAIGQWYIFQSSDGAFRSVNLGSSLYTPAPADFDGDGRADIAVFRTNPGRWFVIRSSDGVTISRKFGGVGGRPVPADYDGDGTDDFAVFFDSGQWLITASSTGAATTPAFGSAGDIPAAGDWDNDGKADLAVFRPGDGTWYLQQSFYGFAAVRFGLQNDVPVPADYNGDGRLDAAVFRPSDRTWYVNLSRGPNLFDGGLTTVQFGLADDLPVTARH